jgi:hypothetical protein
VKHIKTNSELLTDMTSVILIGILLSLVGEECLLMEMESFTGWTILSENPSLKREERCHPSIKRETRHD